MEKERVLTGKLIDEAGYPVVAADVIISQGQGSGYSMGNKRWRTASDANGEFHVQALKPWEFPYNVVVRHPDYVTNHSSKVLIDGNATTPITVVLEKGITFSGTVRDASGNPIIGAEIEINRTNTGLSGSDGKYQVEHLDPSWNVVNVCARAKGYATLAKRVDKEDFLSGNIELILDNSPRSISGTVVNGDGDPVLGAYVSLELPMGPGPSPYMYYLSGIARTDENGNFRVEDLPESDLRIQIYHPDYPRFEESGITSGTENLRLVMEEKGEICGWVVDDRTGNPIPSFRVKAGVRDLYGNVNGLVFSNPDGMFLLNTDIKPGREYTLVVAADGFEPAIIDCQSSPTGSGPLTAIRLKPQESL
jgi:protocatechuate 3,4-dioxygenase beta subunit